jgi:hypothetical protein
MSQDSSSTIATGFRLGRRDSVPGMATVIFTAAAIEAVRPS